MIANTCRRCAFDGTLCIAVVDDGLEHSEAILAATNAALVAATRNVAVGFVLGQLSRNIATAPTLVPCFKAHVLQMCEVACVLALRDR